MYVTPGIRPATSKVDDQERVATPQQAREFGASALVVGRPITQAANPQITYQAITKEFK